MMTDDFQLLNRYARGHDDHAFAEIVQRHLPLVYGTALRKLAGDHALAKDVAQVVFSDLARKAGSLSGQRSLAAWLHKSTCFAASKYVRTEQRRRTREEETIKMASHDSDANPEWNDLAPMLDDALNELSDEDREAVMLRFFNGQKFAELGGRLGVTENAARMRVERAVEKLRGILSRRGLTATGAAVLVALEQAPAAVIIPAGMTTAITTAALAAGGLSTQLIVAGTAASAGSPALWSVGPISKALAGAALVCGLGTWTYLERQESNRLRTELAQVRSTADDTEQLRRENRRLVSRQISPEELARYRSDRLDALRLRNRVALMQSELNDLKTRLAELPPQEETAAIENRPPWQVNERRKVGDFHNVGRSTAEAACETVLWASLNDPQQLASLVHLPDAIAGLPKESLDFTSFAPMLHAYQSLSTNAPVTETWLEKRIEGDVTIQSEASTNFYENIVSFQVTGADALGHDTGRHFDLRFARFEDGWKLIIPGLSPDIRKAISP